MYRINKPPKDEGEMTSTNQSWIDILLLSLSVLLHEILNSKNYFWCDHNVMPHAHMHKNIVENKKTSKL